MDFVRKNIAVLLLSFGLSFGAYAQENSLELDTRNLSNLTEAESVAQEVISKSQPGDQIVLYHVGSSIPENLKYIVQRVAMKNIAVQILKVTLEELQEDVQALADAPESYQTLLTHDTPQRSWKKLVQDAKNFVTNVFIKEDERIPYTGAWKEFGQSVKRLPNRVFGVPRAKDLSFLVKVPTETAIQNRVQRQGMVSAGISSVSMGACFVISYLASGKTLDPSIILPSLALGAWVYTNTIHFRSINQFMTQGKNLVETPTGWKVTSNVPFFWGTGFLRSMLTNSVITVSKNGLSAFSIESLEASALNSAINIFSRSEIDRWIVNHTPTTRDANGKFVVEPGQWNETKLSWVNFVWGTTYGLIKNFNLVASDPKLNSPASVRLAANLLYGGVTAVNLTLMAKPAAINAYQKVKSLWTGAVKKAAMEPVSCQTLLTIQKAK